MDKNKQERGIITDVTVKQAYAIVNGLKVFFNHLDNYNVEFGYHPCRGMFQVYMVYTNVSSYQIAKIESFAQGICWGHTSAKEEV